MDQEVSSVVSQSIERRKITCKECGSRFDPGLWGDKVPQRYIAYEACGRACLRALISKRMPDELAERGVPRRYLDCSLENFKVYNEKLAAKLNGLRELVSSKPKRGIFLFGPVGTGKTHLAVSYMSELIVRGYGGSFIRAIGFIIRCQQSFRNEEDVTSIIDELLDKHFLVLDDIGSEHVTDFVRQSLLLLIDEAYCREKILVVTSNLSLEDLNIIDPRIPSRLAEMCKLFKLDFDDYRVLKAAGHQSATVKSADVRVM